MTQPTPPVALIADDDDFFRLAVVAILTRSFGFAEVIETGSLDAAVDQLSTRRGAVTLALFDLAMPGMEGPGSLSAVRECFPAVKVAVVSASTERNKILTALEVGVHGYVPKGIGSAELTRAVGMILDGQIFVPACLAVLDGAGPRPSFEARIPGPDGRGDGRSLRIPDLTPRQRDVLALLVEGRSNKEIARRLQLGEGTVKVHMAALLRSLGVQNRAAAAVVGARLLAE
ncbi:chemotaxis protein CheY [Methylobacterium indicum]|uniref:Chemotaxis protein CheY n=1 Tax=Methylobacterium indicum TaxID=1775910 RepID=A0A8H8WX27_9HYPH|nr:response regulator transcription factor [Methylobacterium indicum]KMO18373.1 chemotaxis protein CheY [Methylobacterium indicum]KTS36905.1 chemotaxis protein CheY [Methylobacterium indicum]KTS38545.1 chemotaxis protein CheY [Methylobacterium indicum]KTS52248.1 chemotaxis protein CheY [Methylobacterium indicum]BCM85779.1 DNA-binding response regulator [Methylobacterium indicum]